MAYIFSSAALLISVVSFFVLFFYVKNRTRADRVPPETRQEVAKIVNEIDRITDRDSELIEERVKKLKSLLEDIDRRIAVLEGLVENHKVAEETQKKLNGEKQDASIAAYRGLGRKKYMHESLFGTSSLNESVTEDKITDADSSGDTDLNEQSLIRQVSALSVSGVPNHEIAKRLQKTVNEVEMALFLAETGK